MYNRAKISVSMMVVMFLALSVAIPGARAEESVEEFKAVISSDTIKVGQSAVVTLSGGRLDVAGGNILDNIGSEFASIVEGTQIDKIKFKVKGLARGSAVLEFTNGDQEARVKVTVVVGGLN
jgi:hypothetical protein